MNNQQYQSDSINETNNHQFSLRDSFKFITIAGLFTNSANCLYQYINQLHQNNTDLSDNYALYGALSFTAGLLYSLIPFNRKPANPRIQNQNLDSEL